MKQVKEAAAAVVEQLEKVIYGKRPMLQQVVADPYTSLDRGD